MWREMWIREEASMRTETKLIVGNQRKEGLAHVMPLDLSTTYRTPDLDVAVQSLESLAQGAPAAANPVYARLSNPNVQDFEDRMTALEGGAGSIAFASGMAAITALLLEAHTRGAHVVAVPPLYGGTHHLLNSGLLGLRVTWAAADTVGDAIEPDTSLILVETPANPTLTVTDIAQLARSGKGVPIAVDSTFATPILQRPLSHGAAFVLHSATKFIGGHGDAMGGVITTASAPAAARLRQVRIATGAVLHPLAAHTFSRGLQTLGMRVRAQEENARKLVKRFRAHPEVLSVGYPGSTEIDRAVVERQMTGSGTMISLRLLGGPARADVFIEHLELAVAAVSLGSVDTLVQRPAALTHQIVGEQERERGEIADDLIRISVGAEHIEDLWNDFRGALLETSDRVTALTG